MREKPSSLPEENQAKDRVNARNIQTPLLLLKEEITEAYLPAPGKKGQDPPLSLDRVRDRIQIRGPSVKLAVNIILGSVDC